MFSSMFYPEKPLPCASIAIGAYLNMQLGRTRSLAIGRSYPDLIGSSLVEMTWLEPYLEAHFNQTA